MQRRNLALAVPVTTLLAFCLGDGAVAATPATMQAIVQHGTGGPEVLKLEKLPVLQPGEGQVLIRVYAAAVNPIDWRMRLPPADAGSRPNTAAERIPGFDVAGVVERVGQEVTNVKAGDPVLSMIGRVQVTGLNGGYSQYVVAPAANTVAKPANLTYEEAAGIPTVGMTAARTVAEANVQRGQRVFINGIAGGVGSAAAQLAKARGAYVIGTATERHRAYLKSIGVDEVIDYTKVQFEDQVKDVDAVIDVVSKEGATRAIRTVKPGGVLVSIAGNPDAEQCAAAGIRCPGGGAMGRDGAPTEGDFIKQAVQAAAQGGYKVHIDARFPLAQAGAAQERNRTGDTQGKIILTVDKNRAGKR
ncbi:MAG: NADP-dependent oxidoreductase [Steroidobacteraceae bacterium]